MLISLTVGKVDAGVAVLLTEDKRLVKSTFPLYHTLQLTLLPPQIEFPSILLPPSITSGSIVDITVARNTASEHHAHSSFTTLQRSILSTYGLSSPSPPLLTCRNATQTSLVLEWPPLSLATATLRSLSLYRNGAKAGSIPYNPHPPPGTPPILSTKISGLAVDTEYTFHLLLRTSAGTYASDKLALRTQKMTDLTGVTITPGPMPPPLLAALKTAIERIGMKFADTVRIDTTHFVCTEGRGPEWEKAKELNVPVVRPEWVEGCEREGRIVGVRGYYLGADPKLRQVGHSAGLQQQQGQQQQGSSQSLAQQDLQRREAEALAHRQREGDESENTNGDRDREGGAQQQQPPLDSPLPPPTPAKDDYVPANGRSGSRTNVNAAGVPTSADDESEEEEEGGTAPPRPRADDEGEEEEKASLDEGTGRAGGAAEEEEEEEEEEEARGGRTPGGGEGGGFSEVAL